MTQERPFASLGTIKALLKEGVQFGAVHGNKKPVLIGWRTETIKTEHIESEYNAIRSNGGGFIGLLAGSGLVVIDIDKPDKAKRLVQVLDNSGTYRADSLNGVHYYLRSDNDSDNVLQGKEAKKIRDNNRKGGAILGDLLGGAAICYEATNRDKICHFGEVEGLHEALGFKGQSLHRSKTKIKENIHGRMYELEEGDRNSGMFRLLCETARRLHSCGIQTETKIEVMLELVSIYQSKINVGDNGFIESKLREIVTENCAAISHDSNENTCVAGIVMSEYKKSKGGYAWMDCGSSNKEAQEIYEWSQEDKEWSSRNFAQAEDVDKPSLLTNIRDRISQIFFDKNNEYPNEEQLSKISDIVRNGLQDTMALKNPKAKFDRVEKRNMVLLDHGRALDINSEASKVEIVENKPEYMLMNKIGETEDSEPVIWNSFLDDIFPDKEIRKFVPKLIATVLLTDTDPLFGICKGRGANGKSVFLMALAHAFGDFGKMTDPKAWFLSGSGGADQRQLDKRREMIGKRLVVSTEGSKKPLDLEFIKAMTSGEAVETGGMWRVSETVNMQATPLIATNELPRLTDVSDGVRRRIFLLPFDATFGRPNSEKQADPFLLTKLKKEAPKIRNQIINDMRKMVENSERLVLPKKLQQLSGDYADRQTHPIAVDLAKWIEYDPNGNLKIGTRSEGSGKSKEYSGIMALAMRSHSDNSMTTNRAPDRSRVKEWLEAEGIRDLGKGRMSASFTEDGQIVADEIMAEHQGRDIFSTTVTVAHKKSDDSPDSKWNDPDEDYVFNID